MGDLSAESWADALELYDDSYTVVRVGPRDHAEWWCDAVAIIQGEVLDPRGWRSIDPDEDEPERADDPLFPWLAPPSTREDTEQHRAPVKELPRGSVPSLLVLLGIVGWDIRKTYRWEERRPDMEHRAEAIMARFPEDTRFYSNIGWAGQEPDFYEQRVTGMHPFSRYGWDAGLIAVNDTEVTLIWAFMPI